MDPAQLDPNGDGGGRVVGSNSRRVDDTRVKPTPSQSGSRVAATQMTPKNGTWDNLAQESRDLLEEDA